MFLSIPLYILAVGLAIYILRDLIRTRHLSIENAIAALGIVVSLIVAQTVDVSSILQLLQAQITIGQALIGVGVIALIALAGIWLIASYRNRKKQNLVTAKKEYVEAIWDSVVWEIDESSKGKVYDSMLVNGPLCKKCMALMEPQKSYQDRYSRGPSTITQFVCISCGRAIPAPPGLSNEFKIKQQVYELYQAEKRRKELASKRR